MNSAIRVSHLSFSYPDRPSVLQDINLHVNPQERIGVIGHNGSGKTTFFHLMCGLLTPICGTIEILNKRVIPGTFCPAIGLVFQNPDDQLFCASVWEDVAFAPQNMGLSAAEIDRSVDNALQMTGVQTLAQRPPHHLSGGEKRMVAIAGVLAMDPQIILYDEPTANLDLRARRRLIQFLQRSSQTLLIASHDLSFLGEICDRIVLIDQGKLVADGCTHNIFNDRALLDQYEIEPPLAIHSRPDGRV